jgi:hypothetical protein
MAAAGELKLWYIESRVGGPGRARLREALRAQGITRVEVVTDRVLRCWATKRPVLPTNWHCLIAEGADVPNTTQSASGHQLVSGAVVRLRSGPAAGWIGTVRAILDSRAVVEVAVWGKGMTLNLPTAQAGGF